MRIVSWTYKSLISRPLLSVVFCIGLVGGMALLLLTLTLDRSTQDFIDTLSVHDDTAVRYILEPESGVLSNFVEFLGQESGSITPDDIAALRALDHVEAVYPVSFFQAPSAVSFSALGNTLETDVFFV